MTNLQEQAHWRALGREIKRRLREPLRHPTFIFYFFGITILLGGLGVWWELLCRFSGFRRIGGTSPADSWNIVNGMTTYLVALAAASLLDLAIRREQEGFRAFRVVTFLLALIAIFAGSLGLIAEDMTFALVCSAFGLALSLCTWWIVNADNSVLRDDPPATVTTGGNPERSLQGSLDGIKA